MTAAEVPSPCVKVCVMDPATNLCQGCRRTLEEIAGWPAYTATEKRRVLARVAKRQDFEGRDGAPETPPVSGTR